MNRVDTLVGVPQTSVVLAAGAFDGLHLGHVAVVEAARNLACRLDAVPGILRFHPHPSKILSPETAPPLLATEEMLARRLDDLGIHLHVRLPFSKAFAQIEPEAFLSDLKTALPQLKGMVVGSNWRFGHRGRGDFELLRQWGGQHQVEILRAPDTLLGGVMISSTRIRQAIQAGDLAQAAALLGRPYSVSGSVQPGKQYGRDLGFPTANFLPGEECMPPQGVYAMRVRIEDGPGAGYLGAGYITHSPPLVEVHLLEFEGDLYGKKLQVELLEFRRSATPISHFDALRKRIQQDVDGIRSDYG